MRWCVKSLSQVFHTMKVRIDEQRRALIKTVLTVRRPRTAQR